MATPELATPCQCFIQICLPAREARQQKVGFIRAQKQCLEEYIKSTTSYCSSTPHLHTCIARSACHCSCPHRPRKRSPARARPSQPGLRPSAGLESTLTSPGAASASCWRRRRGLSTESRGSCRGASTLAPSSQARGPEPTRTRA